MSEDLQRHARSFGGVADAYDRGRPGYPDPAVDWLVGEQPVTVLELGAGTGKLTARLVAAGHDVHATDPDEAMLAILRERVPGVRASLASAEEIPVADRSVDVVVAAQCFHWFDPDVALPEIARVLRPGGHLAAVWNERDERIPWVRRLGRIIGTQDTTVSSIDVLAISEDFDTIEHAAFKHWQVVDRRSVQDLALSRSNVAVRPEEEREQVRADVLALYDDYGRGMDGMQLPYQARCTRARVTERVAPPAPVAAATTAAAGAVAPAGPDLPDLVAPPLFAGDDPLVDSADTIPRVALEDTGTLLIDFR